MKHWLHNPSAPPAPDDLRDVTIVIQGRLSPRGLAYIPTYQQFGKIIISCWENCDHSLLNGIDITRIPVVISAVPSENAGFNYGNVLLQATTTCHGLLHVTTPWALKIRCDEFYTDLSAFIRKMKADPKKLITNNVFFRRDKMYKFHPSDHVIGGRTDYLRETFRILLDRCASHQPAPPGKPGWMPTEALIATSFLRHIGVPPEPARSREIMRNHFDLVRVRDMGRFYVAFNNQGQAFDNEEAILKSDSIASMEEL